MHTHTYMMRACTHAHAHTHTHNLKFFKQNGKDGLETWLVVKWTSREPELGSRTHTSWFTKAFNYNSRGSDALFWLP